MIDQYRVKTDRHSGIVNGPGWVDVLQYISRPNGKMIGAGLEAAASVGGCLSWGLGGGEIETLPTDLELSQTSL